MVDAVAEGTSSTRTSLNTMFVAVDPEPDGRKAIPSKLKVDAALSVTEVESDAPFARFCQVTVSTRETASARCAINCSKYCPPLAKPWKLFVLPGPFICEVQSPLVPSKELSVAVVRLVRLMGVALLNATPMF